MRTLSFLAGSLLLLGCSNLAPDAGGANADAEASSDDALTAAPFFAGDTANHATFATDVSVWETPLAQSEMDCFWDSGVRHVVVGTQNATVAREQLDMAVSRGMTVDAYVYVYWNADFVSQLNAAFQMVSGYPIGTMWLDIEEQGGAAALGKNEIVARIQAGLATCQSMGIPCGIYTSPGFWKSYVGDTDALADVPLWYALYNHGRSLSAWSTEAFGGWKAPVGKQFQTAPLCGVGGADWDILQVSATPTVVVDRSDPPAPTAPPPAPTGLFPADGSVDTLGYAKLMSGTIPRATGYQLALERWTGSTWGAYYTWSNPNAFVKASLPATPAVYRFRARAENAHGWGAWSAWATFDYGHYTGPRPPSSPSTTPAPAPSPSSTTPAPAPSPSSTAPAPAPSPSTPPPSPPAGVPGSLSPDGGAVVTTSGVTLACSAVDGAADYQFDIESQSGTDWATYYTYTRATPSQTFYPATRGIDYRFRVRANVSSAWGAWSDWATFHVK